MKVQRTVAPTAAPVSFGTLLRALGGLWGGTRHSDRLSRELQLEFSACGVFLVSSGKAALTVILKALAATSTRRRVVVPAYTCFSVPSAVVKAGLEVILCDIDPSTLDFDYRELDHLLDGTVLCVLPTHLFGRPADVDRVKTLCIGKGIVVVEDAAQAMGALSKGRPIGTLGDLGFFSLGRGKNLTCGTGGIILVNSPAFLDSVRKEFRTLSDCPFGGAVRNWLEVMAMKIFTHPLLYWFPAGLPFLGLGETKFYSDFPIARMDEIRARLLEGWKDTVTKFNRERIAQASRIVEGLKHHDIKVSPITSPDDVYLRLPVLVPDRETKRVVCERGREAGVGLTPNYPTTIQEIPELQGRIAARMCPGAQEVVDRLVTLPTHRYVKERDLRNIERVLTSRGREEEASDSRHFSRPVEESSHR